MTRTRATGRTKLMLVAVAAAAALCAAPSASAAPASTLKATDTCWIQVINDWLKNGRVTGTYAIPCYTQAIQHLQAYPDITQYSSAIDDIHRALLYVESHPGGGGPHAGGHGGGTNGGNNAGGPAAGGGNNGGGGPSGGNTAGNTDKGLFRQLAQKLGPGNAQSIPLPLLVLGGLALLLLLSAAATWLARRYQSRRVTPAPAVAKRR